MKGNPAVPGGPSISKPAWRKGVSLSATSAFFAFGGEDDRDRQEWTG